MGKYLIAVATSDGVHVDTPFGEAERFEVYEITKDAYCKLEERTVVQHDEGVLKDGQDADLRSQANDTEHCGCDAGGHSCRVCHGLYLCRMQQDWFSYAEAACKACCNCV
mgnify:CR=1 FL=1